MERHTAAASIDEAIVAFSGGPRVGSWIPELDPRPRVGSWIPEPPGLPAAAVAASGIGQSEVLISLRGLVNNVTPVSVNVMVTVNSGKWFQWCVKIDTCRASR